VVSVEVESTTDAGSRGVQGCGRRRIKGNLCSKGSVTSIKSKPCPASPINVISASKCGDVGLALHDGRSRLNNANARALDLELGRASGDVAQRGRAFHS
jgi:hypothetical protein